MKISQFVKQIIVAGTCFSVLCGAILARANSPSANQAKTTYETLVQLGADSMSSGGGSYTVQARNVDCRADFIDGGLFAYGCELDLVLSNGQTLKKRILTEPEQKGFARDLYKSIELSSVKTNFGYYKKVRELSCTVSDSDPSVQVEYTCSMD